MLKDKSIAVFLSHYSIGKSSPIVCMLDLLTDNYNVDLHLNDVYHQDALVMTKICKVYTYQYDVNALTSYHNLDIPSYDYFMAFDANGFFLCKYLYPFSKPIYYSLELYFRDNAYNLFYPEVVMNKERNEINNINGLIIQSNEREELFRNEYNLSDEIETLILPVTYNHPANKIKKNIFREKFKIPNSIKIALHLGGIQEHHCLIELADSFKNITNWVLIIHGNAFGEYVEKLKNFIIRNQISNVFISNDYVKNIDDMDVFLQSVDVGIAWYKNVSPNFSTAGKSSGKISAYLRFGLPVVVNKFQSTIDAIEHTGCGKCVEHYTEIPDVLIQIENKYSFYSENCRNEYNKYYWFENYKKDIIKFIEKNKIEIIVNQSDEFFINLKMKTENMDNYFIRQSIKKFIDENINSFRGNLIDLGCGQMPYKDYILTNNKNINSYIGIDIINPIYQKQKLPDLYWDGKTIPLEDNSIDTLLALELFEHLPELHSVLKEVNRVLKPDGNLYFTVPFLWPLHDAPNDEFRYTPFSLKRILRNCYFDDIIIKATGGWNASLAQMLGLWLRRSGLDEDSREKLTEQLWAFYKELIEKDIIPEKFDNGPMVTGFSGVAKKKKNIEKLNTVLEIKKTNQNKELKKVIFVVNFFPKLSETFIVAQIIGLINKNVEIEIWALNFSEEEIINSAIIENNLFSKVRYIQLPDNSLNEIDWFNAFIYLNKLIVNENDVFHIHFGQNYLLLEKLFIQIENPVIVSFHGLDASQYILENGQDCYNRLFKRVDLITTPSREMQEVLLSIGSDLRKMVVHHCGVDTKVFYPQKRKATNDKIRLLSVGRLVEKKGIEYSIKAFAKLNTKNVIYDIIGEGPLEKSLSHLIYELGISDKVRLLGAKTSEEIVEELRKTDIYVLTSVTAANGDKEGLPVTLIEAQSSGIPVVSTYHAGIPELVTDESSGFLCNEKDVLKIAESLDKLIRSYELREKFSQNARNKVIEEFDIEKLNDKLYEYYITLIQKKNIFFNI